MASYDVVDVSELEGEGPGGMVRKTRRAVIVGLSPLPGRYW